MALIKTTAEFKAHAPSVWSSFEFDTILPMVKQAETKIFKKVLGLAQYTPLEAAYQAATMTPEQEALIEALHPALVQLSLYFAIPQLDLSLTDSGFVISSSQNFAPAAQWRVDNLRESTMKLGYSSLDDMLEFMELNKADYPLWTGDAAYTITKDSFLNSAKEFSDQYAQLQNSRWLYLQVRPIMKRLEVDLIKTRTGTNLFNEIKTQIVAGTVSNENQILLDFIRHAIAYGTIAEAVNEIGLRMDENGLTIYESKDSQTTVARKNAPEVRVSKLEKHCRAVSEMKLTELQTYLKANAATYPLYEADTTVYLPDEEAQFKNSDDNTFYAAL